MVHRSFSRPTVGVVIDLDCIFCDCGPGHPATKRADRLDPVLHRSGRMSRPLRLEVPGGHYHVIARGNDRETIFRDSADFRFFLAELDGVGTRLRWAVLAYCLMTNHYHLVLRTAEPNLARGMRDLNGQYAQSFNRRHERTGHLFQGRYKAILVERDGYLKELIRYVVLNPVRAGLSARPVDWPWSSHRATCGLAPASACLDVTRVLPQFGADAPSAAAAYASFVNARIDPRSPSAPSPNPTLMGTAAFAARLRPRAARLHREVPRPQKRFRSLDDHLRTAASFDDALRQAFASGAYTLTQIAQHVGLHYSTVSRLVKEPRRRTRVFRSGRRGQKSI